jgi:hypothetical protein
MVRRRPGSAAMTAVRASALISGHAAISTLVRPQPMQNSVRGSTTHTLIQGLISAVTT